MSKTTFEKLDIPYEERDGIFYPVLVAGTEKADIDVGKYGRMWIKYIKEEYPMRYKSLDVYKRQVFNYVVGDFHRPCLNI